MAEHEFERFLAMLSKLLKLSSKETAAVADEICDHLEERYSELVALGIARDDAVKQALDEFDDAGEFAAKLNQLVRQRTRRRIMTGALTTAAASALTILVTTAFWPDQRPGVATAVSSVAQDAGKEAAEADGEVIYIDHARYLPESLRKAVEIDLHDVELSAFAKYVQEQSGFPVIIDKVELTNAGIGPDQKLTLKTFQLPLYLVMDRLLEDVGGTDLAWRLDDDVIEITTREKADTLSEAYTVDVSELLDLGMSMQDIIYVIHQHVSGPWQDIDGEGGTMMPLGTRLTFAQTQRGRFEVLSILEGLKTPGRRIAVDQPDANRKIALALSSRVNCDFQDEEFVTVIEDFGQQADIPIVLDHTELKESGVNLDSSVSLSLPTNSLQRVLRILLQDVSGVELAAVPKDGVLYITTRDKADTIQSVEILDVSDLATRDEMDEVVNLLHHGASGPWQDIDGEGGTVTPVPKQRVVVRQTRRGLESIQRLLGDHRRAMRARPARPEPDLNAVELRYYNMTDKLAGELQAIIPRLVAVDSWMKLPDGTAPLIEKISVGDQPPTGLGGYGGGLGGGGGFFQLGAAATGSAETPAVESLLSKIAEKLEAAHQPTPAIKAILAVRQTRRVHHEIDRFLRDLAEKAWGPTSGGGFGGAGLGSGEGGMGGTGGGFGGHAVGAPR